MNIEPVNIDRDHAQVLYGEIKTVRARLKKIKHDLEKFSDEEQLLLDKLNNIEDPHIIVPEDEARDFPIPQDHIFGYYRNRLEAENFLSKFLKSKIIPALSLGELAVSAAWTTLRRHPHLKDASNIVRMPVIVLKATIIVTLDTNKSQCINIELL